MTTELAACPFCGGQAHPALVQAGGIEWAQVECVEQDCGATGPTPATEAEAIAAWNLRTPPQAGLAGEFTAKLMLWKQGIMGNYAFAEWAYSNGGRILTALTSNTDRERVLREPTEAMLNAARDWSVAKYGFGIDNGAAIGCWQAMFDATLSPTDTGEGK